jgi:hypothetical protein
MIADSRLWRVITALCLIAVGSCKSPQSRQVSEVAGAESSVKEVFKNTIFSRTTPFEGGAITVMPAKAIKSCKERMALAQTFESAVQACVRDVGNINTMRRVWDRVVATDRALGKQSLSDRMNAIESELRQYVVQVPLDVASKPVAMVVLYYRGNVHGVGEMANEGISLKSSRLRLGGAAATEATSPNLDDPDWADKGIRELGKSVAERGADYEAYLDQAVGEQATPPEGQSASAPVSTNRQMIEVIFKTFGEGYLQVLGVGVLGSLEPIRFTNLLAERPTVHAVEFSASSTMGEALNMEVRLLLEETYQQILSENPMLKEYEHVWSN